MKRLIQISSLVAAVVLVSCNSDDVGKLDTQFISNLPADPPTGFGPQGQPIGTTGKFTLFSFASGSVVANADSLTDKWDIGFRGTTIIINGGTDRIGTAGVQLVQGEFANLTTAPEAGYLEDAGNTLAVNSSWYTYNATARTVIPNAGSVFMIRTAKGKYAKMEILSYYQDAPSSPTSNDASRYYTFQFVHQPSGSRKF